MDFKIKGISPKLYFVSKWAVFHYKSRNVSENDIKYCISAPKSRNFHLRYYMRELFRLDYRR